MSSPREGALVSDLASFAADSSVVIPPDLQQRLSADGIDTPAALQRRQRLPPRPRVGAGHPGNAGDWTTRGHAVPLDLEHHAHLSALSHTDTTATLTSR